MYAAPFDVVPTAPGFADTVYVCGLGKLAASINPANKQAVCLRRSIFPTPFN